MAIKKVWIDDGCIICGVCESTCPEVFLLGKESVTIREDADIEANEEAIKDAAANCPVDVIKFE